MIYISQYNGIRQVNSAVTKQGYDLTGLAEVWFNFQNRGRGDQYYTQFRLLNDSKYNGSTVLKEWEEKGTEKGHDYWHWASVNLSGNLDTGKTRGQTGGNVYLSLATRTVSSGKHDGRLFVDEFILYNERYDFDLQPSPKAYNRKIYDFTSTSSSGATPVLLDTFYNGATEVNYYPGIEANYDGFYYGADSTLTIKPTKDATSHYLTLKGVYFTHSGKDRHDMFDGSNFVSQQKSGVYYVAAGADGTVNVKMDTSFVKTLISRGVLKDDADVESIKIFPVFDQKMTEVEFLNTGDSATYDETDKGSAWFANILESWANSGRKETAQTTPGVLWKQKSWMSDFWINVNTYEKKTREIITGYSEEQKHIKLFGLITIAYRTVRTPITETEEYQVPVVKRVMTSRDSYHMLVPMLSIIRLKGQSAGDSIVTSGLLRLIFDKVNLIQAGDKMASSRNPEGDTAETSDIGKLEFSVKYNYQVSIMPNTREQNLTIGYLPTLLSEHRNAADYPALREAVSSLTGRATIGTLQNPVMGSSDANGKATADTVSGGIYTLTAKPPEGYATFWVHLTGDTNGNGILESGIDQYPPGGSRNDDTVNPKTMVGDTIYVSQTLNDMIFYYYFWPVSYSAAMQKTGLVRKEENTFLGLVRGAAATAVNPVENVYVEVTGNSGLTDAKGQYSVGVSAGAATGYVSTLLRTNGREFSAYQSLEEYYGGNAGGASYNTPGELRLRAFEPYTPYNLTAVYEKSGAVKSQDIEVKNETLTLEATVLSTASLYPTSVRFSIRDGNGRIKLTVSPGESEALPSAHQELQRSRLLQQPGHGAGRPYLYPVL